MMDEHSYIADHFKNHGDQSFVNFVIQRTKSVAFRNWVDNYDLNSLMTNLTEKDEYLRTMLRKYVSSVLKNSGENYQLSHYPLSREQEQQLIQQVKPKIKNFLSKYNIK